MVHTEKTVENPCDFDLWPWNVIGFMRLSTDMCVRNFI